MKPLHGIKILDLSRILAGPWCTQLLSDLGASVVKVERPYVGDDTRKWKSSTLRDSSGNQTDESAYYLAANRGKKSVAIDFSSTLGQQLIKRLVRDADILVENYKTNQLKKYGLDWESLKKINPRLIYCSITGFGQTGPYSSLPGYDYIIQAMSGIMSVTGQPDSMPGGGPMRCGIPVVDYTTGLYSAIAILAALNKRSLTGEGEHIDVALYDCAVALMSIHLQNTLLSGRDASRTGIYNPFVAPYQVFKALDKHFVLAIGNDRQFFKFCQLIGEEDLCQSDKYKTNYARLKHRQELEQIISSRVKTRSADEWIDIFRANDIPAGPINTAKEILNDEQVKSRQIVFQIEHPLLKPEDKLSMISCPIRFEGNSVVNSKISPPIRGQDTVSVLSAYGLSESELVLLKKNKVIE